MSEIVEFVHHGAASVTPRALEKLLAKIPALKIEFAQINAPTFPHLVEQLEFLADLVEDFAEGADQDLPYVAVAAAAFALVYAHRQMDLIPDFVGENGRADDSAIVRAVLIEHERACVAYAARHGLNWSNVSTRA